MPVNVGNGSKHTKVCMRVHFFFLSARRPECWEDLRLGKLGYTDKVEQHLAESPLNFDAFRHRSVHHRPKLPIISYLKNYLRALGAFYHRPDKHNTPTEHTK